METRTTSPLGFAASAVAAILLATLADFLFFGAERLGAILGGFALAWAAALLVASPVAHRGSALVATLAAFGFALLLVEDPGPLAWALFWAAVASAAILTKHPFDDALRWVQRLLLYVSFGLFGPLADRQAIRDLPMPRSEIGLGGVIKLLALPAIGGVLFLTLFAIANPIIADAFASLRVPDATSMFLHALLWLVAFMTVWPSFRPHPRVGETELGAASLEWVPSVPLASILISLVTFNAVFAVQNALDVAFLWSGAPLPGTITLADYAHRGAYMLIATALLAGLFVLTVLRPGSDSAKSPLVKVLVVLWVAQNLLLVASSILRTLDYIGAYQLTVLRIWALGWMGLVGVGLALICWRLLAGRSAAWLINMNALAAVALLTVGAAIDPAAVAAQWNVRHARETGGTGMEIDLCYLDRLGPSALLPLIELEDRVEDLGLLDRVRALREDAMRGMAERQADWQGWTFRNQRRLATAQALLGPKPAASKPALYGRGCDGSPTPPPPPAPAPAPVIAEQVLDNSSAAADNAADIPRAK